jgi:hypothetical protein
VAFAFRDIPTEGCPILARFWQGWVNASAILFRFRKFWSLFLFRPCKERTFRALVTGGPAGRTEMRQFQNGPHYQRAVTFRVYSSRGPEYKRAPKEYRQ